jgi:3-hydroxyisobutyrate dehydrogenase-like beta-hydroxyacid dehydrogenase
MAAVKRSLNVGMVGVGRMGGPLLVNLAFKSRNSLYLQVHSRSKTKASEVVDKLQRDGCQSAIRMHDKYSTVTKWCDVIIACLKDETVSRAVMLEREDALLRNAKRGQIIIDHSDVDVETAKECYEVAQRRGANYIDAPISGTVAEARNGAITIMAGGDREAFERALPLIRLYSENAHHMGASGTGAAAKSITQALVAMHTVAAAEAMALADAMGVQDVKTLLRVLDTSQGSSMMLRRNGSKMMRMLRNPSEIPDGGIVSVDKMLHQIAVCRESSKELPDEMLPLLSTARRAFAQTSQAGIGGKDLSAVVHFLDGAGSSVAVHGSEHGDSEGDMSAGSEQAGLASPSAVPLSGTDSLEYY